MENKLKLLILGAILLVLTVVVDRRSVLKDVDSFSMCMKRSQVAGEKCTTWVNDECRTGQIDGETKQCVSNPSGWVALLLILSIACFSISGYLYYISSR